MPPRRAAGPRKSALAQSRTVNDEFEMQGEEFGDLRERERELKHDMVAGAKLRKGEKQRRLEEAFEDQVGDLEGQIDEMVEEYEQGTKRIQHDFVTRLLALAQRKADIEKQIVRHTQELAEAYDIVRGEFQAILKGRSEDVHDATNALCRLQEDNKASPDNRN